MAADPVRDQAVLAGRTVVTTRERPGELDAHLRRLGATVIHVPLIETVDPDDGGAALAAALSEPFDWVVVTSPAGAERVAPTLRGRRCRIAAVGTRTAEVVRDLAGRSPDVVPARQTAADLAAAMPPATAGERLVFPHADRADAANAARFSALGYAVRSVVAYRTVLRRPARSELDAALAADAVAFASGSAAQAWADAIGIVTPPVVVAIGPTTARAATEAGIKVTAVASDHSIEGLTRAIVGVLTGDS